jgi:hypothetical protein
MPIIKVGVREFREGIVAFLESGTAVAGTRRLETVGAYVPTRWKGVKAADLSELKAAAGRLGEVLSDVDEKELVREFKDVCRRGNGVARLMIVLDANMLNSALSWAASRASRHTRGADGSSQLDGKRPSRGS